MQHTVRKSITVTKDSKLIIALGDSFVEGQGAVSEKTWEKFDWYARPVGPDRQLRSLLPRCCVSPRRAAAGAPVLSGSG